MSDKYIIYDPAEFDKIEIKPVENSDEITRLRAELAAVTAERDRLQIMHDEAYIAGMKHGWNCCAAGDEERYKRTVENTREQIRRARAEFEGATK